MKKISIILLTYILLVGFTYGKNSPNVKVKCKIGNETRIYFPVDKIDNLEVSENSIINISSQEIYGYAGNTIIYFPTYDEPYYTNEVIINLNITEVLENNLYENNYKRTIKDNFQTYMLGIGGVIIAWLIFTTKRS